MNTPQPNDPQAAFQTPAGYTVDPDVKTGEVAVNTKMSPRDIALQAIEEKTDKMHKEQIVENAENDPGIKAIQDRMQEGQDASRAAAVVDGTLPAEELDPDGAASRQAMHPEKPALPEALPAKPAVAALPAELADDPLADHIVMDDGKPMFVLKVSGKDMLMPLTEARRQLQIGTAAEIRMQNASAKEKLVEVRERKLTAGEEALAQRARTIPSPRRSLPAQPELSEEDIRSKSKEIFISAFHGTEDDAAEKLTKLLLQVRTPPVIPAAPVDEAAIISKAATAAVGAVTVANEKKDLVSGYEIFRDQYPLIMGDANLYRMADGMTDEIATEHPTWSKSQVMLESGKRTSAWVENLKGTAQQEPDKKPELTAIPEDLTISQTTLPPTQSRQQRKTELVRIPEVAAATQVEPEPEEQAQSPQAALDEVRSSRGQPTAG